MSILYIIWAIYCISPMALVMFLFQKQLTESISMSTDIEYVGGPDDGHRTILIAPEGQEDEIITTYSHNKSINYKYKRTNRRNSEGFLIYGYAGSTACDKG